jgi:Flp pilus assembly protein TadD
MRASTDRIGVGLVLAILILTVACYWQITSHGFLGYDDNLYVTENPLVREGITLPGLLRAFVASDASNWHPFTWWSHMLDVELFGMNAGAHHAVNLLLHLASTVLIYLFFRRATRTYWRSAFVAAVFALHPMHVQSVAWIAERKDVLSTFFWALALLAYLRSSKGRKIATSVIVLYAIALLCKPMVITLPFLLVLLDRWPLARTEPLAVLIRQKIPLFVLSIASGVVTFLVQSSSGAVLEIPLGLRIGNAVVAYAEYLLKGVWPSGLSAFYPHPRQIDPIELAVSAAALLLITMLALRQWNSRPWLATGWFWYLGTLVPVIGLVQVGGQSIADRYTYVPFIGISIIVAWGLRDFVRVLAARRRFDRQDDTISDTARFASILILACAVLVLATRTRVEASYWRDDRTLFEHALAVTTENHVAHTQVGLADIADGRLEDALPHLHEAVRIRPEWSVAQKNLGKLLTLLGRPAEAEEPFRRALELEPSALAHADLASSLLAQRKLAEAIQEYETAIALDPNFAEAYSSMAVAYLMQNDLPRALDLLDHALELRPDYADGWVNRGIALNVAGRNQDAIESFERALQLVPGHEIAARRLEAVRMATTPLTSAADSVRAG